MHNLLCMTDKGSEYRHLSTLLSTSPNRFSDVSICQGPNENMMRRIYDPRGRVAGWEGRRWGEGWNEGWLQREDEGRENTLCPYFWAPSGIHSSWSFLFRCCCCWSVCLSLLSHFSLYLHHPHFPSVYVYVYVRVTRINVFILLFISFFFLILTPTGCLSCLLPSKKDVTFS